MRNVFNYCIDKGAVKTYDMKISNNGELEVKIIFIISADNKETNRNIIKSQSIKLLKETK